MTTRAPHPDILASPGGLLWRRAERRRHGAGPQAHAELVVLLGLSGRAEYLLDETAHELGAGTLVWALAGQAHVLLSDTPEFDMWVALVPRRVLPGGEAGLPPLSRAEAPPLAPRRLGLDETRALSALAGEVAAMESAAGRMAGLRFWLARCWAAWGQAGQGPARAVHPAVARAAGLLRDDPALALGAVARRAGLSRSRLAELFRAETGQTLAAYRTAQRLGQVEAALAAGERNLTRAALEAGFGSYAQFYRCVVARHGTGPRAVFLNDKTGAPKGAR